MPYILADGSLSATKPATPWLKLPFVFGSAVITLVWGFFRSMFTVRPALHCVLQHSSLLPLTPPSLPLSPSPLPSSSLISG